MVNDANWNALCQRLRLGAEAATHSTWLRSQYCRPDRHYHNLQHLEECLTFLAEARQQQNVPNADAIELALWFHDVVYDPRAADNEEKSAEVATQFLLRTGAVESLRLDVSRLILATKTHRHDEHSDAMWLLDIDLAILGQTEARFAEYEGQIRQEYSWVDEMLYRQKRAEIMDGFLSRPRIYATDYFHQRLDKPARANLHSLIQQLRV